MVALPPLPALSQSLRRRLLRMFVRRGLLPRDHAQAMAQWAHGSGFSVDGSLRIEAEDRAGRGTSTPMPSRHPSTSSINASLGNPHRPPRTTPGRRLPALTKHAIPAR
jgi:hypothetical protein